MKYNPEDVDVFKYKINTQLAKDRGLSDERIVAIEEVGTELFRFLARPTMYADPKDAAYIVRGYEYVLQTLWGFHPDAKMHRYALDLKGCKCADLIDNIQYPIHGGMFWVDIDCPFHGNK